MVQPAGANIDLKKIFGADFDETQCNVEVMKHFIQAYTPTAEDIAHQFTPQEEMELCRRVKCRVLMRRWNPVSDYEERFLREGRLQKKTIQKANALLAKAVNKHKKHALYTRAEIQAQRDEEWRQRKKDNILRLRLWAHDRENVGGGEQREESVNEDASQEQEMVEEHLIEEELEVDDDFMDATSLGEDDFAYLTYSESQLQENLNKDGNNNSENKLAPATTPAAAGSLPAAVMRFNDLNTESLTLGSQSQLESAQHSEVSIFSMPTEYDDFTLRLPLTSTQSQSQNAGI